MLLINLYFPLSPDVCNMLNNFLIFEKLLDSIKIALKLASTKCRTQDAGYRTYDGEKNYSEYEKKHYRAHYSWDLCNGIILDKYHVHIFDKMTPFQKNTAVDNLTFSAIILSPFTTSNRQTLFDSSAKDSNSTDVSLECCTAIL